MVEMTRGREARGIFWGGVLVFVGAWFLAERLGYDLPPLYQLWPIFPMLSGAGSLLGYFSRGRKDPKLIFPGIFGILIGIFFFCFTLGALGWEEMGLLWPVFPLVAGISFLATWLVGGCKENELLIPGGLSTTVGVVGLLLTVGDLTVRDLRLAGSLFILAIGAVMVARSLRSPSSR